MQASDIMTTDVITVSDASSVKDAAAIMPDRGISALPVVDASGTLVGIVSEGDLVRRVEAGTGRRRSWWLYLFTDAETLAEEFVKEHSRKVKDVMKRKAITARPDTPLFEIAALMEKNHIKRVPILEDGRLVGIVSRANLVQALTVPPKVKEQTVGMADAEIRDTILARLRKEPWSPLWLSVIVENGVVNIWGSATTEAQKKAARVAAELTPGVVAVNDNIVLRQPATE